MPDIRHLVSIKSTPEKIYEAITTRKGLASWWSTLNNAKPEKESVYRISFGSEYYKEIRVTELNPPTRVAWLVVDAHPDWIDTRVTFDLKIGDSRVDLHFNHMGWKDYSDMFAQCNHHWGVYLQNLRIYC